MRGGYYGGAVAQLTCAQVLLPASHSSTSKSLARRTRPASLEAMFFAALPRLSRWVLLRRPGVGIPRVWKKQQTTPSVRGPALSQCEWLA